MSNENDNRGFAIIGEVRDSFTNFDSIRFHIEKQNERTVLVGDITLPSDVNSLQPDLNRQEAETIKDDLSAVFGYSDIGIYPGRISWISHDGISHQISSMEWTTDATGKTDKVKLICILNPKTDQGDQRTYGPNYGEFLKTQWFWHQCGSVNICLGKFYSIGASREKSQRPLPVIVIPKVQSVAPRQAEKATVDIEPHYDVESPINLSDFIGSQYLVDRAKLLVSMMRNPDSVLRRGTELPRGVLFYGPPGTGKTHLAQLIARESGAGFQLVMASSVHEMWFGASERNLVRILTQAEERAKSDGCMQILFFDEMEALMRSRGQATTHRVDGNVLSILLSYMSGVGSQTGKETEKSASIPTRSGRVIILGASNMPELSDEAVLREGRFDWKLYVGPPETDEERKQLFSLYLEKASEQAGSRIYDITPESLVEVAACCPGFTGAQLKAVVEQVLQRKLENELLHGEAWSPVNADELKAVAMDIAATNDSVRKDHGQGGEPLWKELFK